jgi:GT2 family glycosyltransferase
MKKIAVLLTVFNRKDKTLPCLHNLFLQELPKDFVLEVFLVNDGCTDGTPEAVKAQFPLVNIINSKGDLFWNQGMRLAWNTASKQHNFDFFIWLNDDTVLMENAIAHLLNCYKEVLTKTTISSIITGACMESMQNPVFSYGGRTEEKSVEPNGSLQQCKYINGNIVLVPREIFNEIGVLSNDYTHGMGDYDYGLRAQQKGFLCYTTKDYIAICPINKGIPVWCNPSISFKNRKESFYSPLGLNIKEYLVFRKKFWPILWISYALKAYLRLLFPMYYNKMFNK